MNTDIDLDVWSGQWRTQSDAPSAAELEDRVTRQTRWMKVGLLAPVLVTLVIGGGVAAGARRAATPEAVVLTVEVWLFILITWVGSLWIARGTWRPLGETTAAFVGLSIRRCQSNLRGVQFGALLYIGELLFMVAWHLRYSSIRNEALLTSWPVVVLGWIGAPALLGFLVWFTRRRRSELAYLMDMQRQLEDKPGTGT